MVVFKPTYLFTKLSLCLVYAQLFKRADSLTVRITRVLVYLTTFVVVGYYGAATIVSIFQCTPIEKSYFSKTPGTCIDLVQFRFSGHAVNIITSIMVIAIPLPALFQMKDKRPEIKQLLFLILLGLVYVMFHSPSRPSANVPHPDTPAAPSPVSSYNSTPIQQQSQIRNVSSHHHSILHTRGF